MFSIDQPSDNPDQNDELLVSIPRPRWRVIKSLLVSGLLLAVTLFSIYLFLTILLRRDDLTVIQVAFHVLIITLAVIVTFVRVVMIWFALQPPLEIFKSGIAMQGMKRSWEHVEDCGWSKYSPDTLKVRSYRQQCLIPIPPNQRAEVESALRNAGKWQS